MIRKHKGFTLIEALIAMTIIAVALIACLKAAGNLNIQQDDLIKRQYAQWSAQNTANFIRVSGVFPAPQTIQSACNQGPFRLVCKVNIINTLNPHFRRIEIQVNEVLESGTGNQLARLVLFSSNAP